MKATIYNFGSNSHGFFIQRNNPTKVINNITKKELMSMADLKHHVLNKNEFYEALSTDINGHKRKEFELLGSTFLIVVNI